MTLNIQARKKMFMEYLKDKKSDELQGEYQMIQTLDKEKTVIGFARNDDELQALMDRHDRHVGMSKHYFVTSFYIGETS